PPLTSAESGYFFGGHTVVRQGFRDFQVQGVEFYQLGQGGRLGHYPVHFHVARKTSADPITHTPRAFLKDSSVHHPITRCVPLHGTQDILVSRNVGFKSIGHGHYLADRQQNDNQ